MASLFARFSGTFYNKRVIAFTNTFTCTILLGAGDLVQQSIGIYAKSNGRNFDFKRTGRICIVGLVLGPMNHYWYKFLDGRLPGYGRDAIMKKVIADFLSCPLFSITFVTGVDLLEGHSIKFALKEYASKFAAIVSLDFCVWPATQYINFRYLPPQARVLYISSIQLFYNACISYIKHEMNYGERFGMMHEDAESLPIENVLNT